MHKTGYYTLCGQLREELERFVLVLSPLACAQQQAQGNTVGMISSSLHFSKGCQGLLKHDCLTLHIKLASGHMLMRCSLLYA